MRTRLSELKLILGRLKQNEDGAALTEYVVVLGIIITVTLAIIAIVAAWIKSQWAAMNTHL